MSKSCIWSPLIAARAAKLGFHFLSFMNSHICCLLSAGDVGHCSHAATLHYSSNIISVSFWWRPHKSDSFISRRHTSLKTAGRILLFLSNRLHSIFRCQDPSWLTSAASIPIPYLAAFSLFSRHLSDKCAVPCVCVCFWLAAFSLDRLFGTVASSTMTFFFFFFSSSVFLTEMFWPSEWGSGISGPFRGRPCSLQKKNGGLAKCRPVINLSAFAVGASIYINLQLVWK